MGSFIVMALLIAVAIAVPGLAIFIIPFIIVSILVGFGMRSVGGAITEPMRTDMNAGAERIAQAIERRNAEAWASQWDDTIVDEEGNVRVVDDPPETPEPVATPAPKPKNVTKKKPTVRKKRKPRAKKNELPNADDLIKDIEDELFGKNK